MTPVSACVQNGPDGATVIFDDGRRVTYRCDPQAHRVAAVDESGAVLFAFGEYGLGSGRFDTPIDAVLVVPTFADEKLPEDLRNIVWVAVADYGNQRIQVFELDGVFVGMLEDIEGAAAARPCRLVWRAPILEVETIDGGRARVLLSAALLAGTSVPPLPSARASRRATRLH